MQSDIHGVSSPLSARGLLLNEVTLSPSPSFSLARATVCHRFLLMLGWFFFPPTLPYHLHCTSPGIGIGISSLSLSHNSIVLLQPLCLRRASTSGSEPVTGTAGVTRDTTPPSRHQLPTKTTQGAVRSLQPELPSHLHRSHAARLCTVLSHHHSQCHRRPVPPSFFVPSSSRLTKQRLARCTKPGGHIRPASIDIITHPVPTHTRSASRLSQLSSVCTLWRAAVLVRHCCRGG